MARPALLAANWPTVTRFTGQGGVTGLLSNLPNGWDVPQVWTGLVMEKFWENSILARICNTDIEEPIKRGGGEAIIRQRPPITINPWYVNQNLNFQALDDEAITIPIKNAYYAAARLDSVDLAQMDLNMMDILAEDMNNQHMENEMSVVISQLCTQITAAIGTTVDYIEVPGVDPYNRLNGTVLLNYSASTGSRTDANYIVKQIMKLRTVFNQKRLPTAGRFIVIPPHIEEILALSDQATWNISGVVSKPVETGEYGLRVAGFDLIVSNFVPISTFTPASATGGQTPTAFTGYTCLAGIKKGYAFARQVTEADIGFDLGYLSFGKGLKTLNLFGTGVSNWAASAIIGFQTT